jgi:16S rRNA (guanine527-N7)-methyltransferase
LSRFFVLLKDWNGKINLVSRKDIDNLLPNHILDSLVALPLLQEFVGLRHSETLATPDPQRICDKNQDDGDGSVFRVMDLGPGGGFPGIPLKICLPEMEIVFVEATQKKAKFIELAIQELGLTGSTVIPKHSRDLLKDPAHLGHYDIITARAVSELKELVKDSFPFLAPGGQLLAYKASKADEEITAAEDVIRKLGGKLEHGISLSAPLTGKERRIVVVRKSK